MVEIGERDAGKSRHGLIAEIGSAMVIVRAIMVVDVKAEFAGLIAAIHFALGAKRVERLSTQ
jgi:hypothetical protein